MYVKIVHKLLIRVFSNSQNKDADAVPSELPVANGIVKANKNLAIVHFDKNKGFDIDTSVSIGLKEGTRGTDNFKQIQKALDSISQKERLKIMEDAVNRAPSTN